MTRAGLLEPRRWFQCCKSSSSCAQRLKQTKFVHEGSEEFLVWGGPVAMIGNAKAWMASFQKLDDSWPESEKGDVTAAVNMMITRWFRC